MNADQDLPDYSGHSLVNLMQSVATACACPSTAYPPLAGLPAKQLAEARHIVLLVIDGLGQKMLDGLPPQSNLRRYWRSTLNSVFPSTTASAITTFMSGLAPAQHGLTGWHMHLEEIGQTLAILPMSPRAADVPALPQDLPGRLFDYPTLFQRLGRECWVLAPKHIAGSPFNAWHSRGATTLAYASLSELFAQLAGVLHAAPLPCYIYAYYPDLDSVSHRFGTDSVEAQQTLAGFDNAFGDFINDVQGCDAWLLATADHGFIDSPPERVVSLDDHPHLAALLGRPLTGERRAAYAHVPPENRPAFEAYVGQQLAHCTDLQVSTDLIREGWFGPPPWHTQLSSRIGDYTLVMKDNWTIKDWLPGEKRYRLVGVHGGISADEMRVPLIALRV